MTRLRSAPAAILAVLVSAGAVAAFTVPSAATQGLAIATEHSGRTVPAFPTTTGQSLTPKADPAGAGAEAVVPAVLPDAASHGPAVAAVATAEDTTPATNHGADVSAVARQNQGQATAAENKPADARKSAGAGKPADPGIPADPGPPDGAGRP